MINEETQYVDLIKCKNFLRYSSNEVQSKHNYYFQSIKGKIAKLKSLDMLIEQVCTSLFNQEAYASYEININDLEEFYKQEIKLLNEKMYKICIKAI